MTVMWILICINDADPDPGSKKAAEIIGKSNENKQKSHFCLTHITAQIHQGSVSQSASS